MIQMLKGQEFGIYVINGLTDKSFDFVCYTFYDDIDLVTAQDPIWLHIDTFNKLQSML